MKADDETDAGETTSTRRHGRSAGTGPEIAAIAAAVLATGSVGAAGSEAAAAGSDAVRTPEEAAAAAPASRPRLRGTRTIQPADTAPALEEILEVTRIEELALSPGGERLLATTRRTDVDAGRDVRNVWRVDPATGETEEAPSPPGARDVAWRPGSAALSYLAPHDGPPQVWVDPPDGDARPVTSHPGGVRSYAWSPVGGRLAYTGIVSRPGRGAGEGGDAPASAGDGGRDAGPERGVELSPAWARIQQLFGDELSAGSFPVPPRTELRAVDPGSGEERRVSGGRPVTDFAWSPDGSRLAYTAREPGDGRVVRADLRVWSWPADDGETVAEGADGRPFRGGGGTWDGAVSFSRPVWGPDGRRVAALRTDHSDGWSATPELHVVDLGSGDLRRVTDRRETQLAGARLEWTDVDRIRAVHTRDARRGLSSISVPDGGMDDLLRSDRHRSSFAFSASGDTVAWVEEAADHPPEVHVTTRDELEGGDGEVGRRLTAFNDGLRDRGLPKARSVTWRSSDGTEVEGWLLTPADWRPEERYPLLVMVHGGPGYAVRDRFSPYAPWPYPLEALAGRGYLVLMPNYRGTGTYGKDFQEPDALDGQPVEDVLSGVDALAERGWADADRVGVLGQSHGGWLGPMLLAERPEAFAAASFAEGMANATSLYGQMSGWRNRNIHEGTMHDATPYTDPDRYREISPILRDGPRSTPTLLEYGQEGMAFQGFEYASALWREGTPHEFVVYPGAGHALRSPDLQLDSMRRNLAWFERWIEPGPDGDAR